MAKAKLTPCARCGTKAEIAEGLDSCAECTIKEVRRAKTRAYRVARKKDGKPDATKNSKASNKARNARKYAKVKAKREAEKAAAPPKPLHLEHAADRIAAEDTSAPLTYNEKKQLSADEAVEIELARRELARRSLIHFIQRRNPRYKAGWFHHRLCAALDQFSQDVIDEKEPRVLFFAPPRHGKSMIGSEEFPAHHFGKAPWHQFIGVSYSAPLAYRFSRKVQDIVDSDEYRMLFPKVKLRDDMTAIDEWGLTEGGVYVAAGVGGPISGKGAHILDIDDVIKNREEADSALKRAEIQNWYTSTAYTRLMPGGGVLAINTRWNYDDLMGWLLQRAEEAQKLADESGEWPENYDKWDVYDYPAIALVDEAYRKQGEPLHAARYSLKALLRIKNTIGDRDFNALYQQRPTPDEGDYFSKESIKYFHGSPRNKEFTIIVAGDLAISKKEYSDWSVFVVAGINANDDIFILDVVRGKWNSLELVDRIFEIQRTYNPVLFGLEQGQIEKALGPLLQKRMMEEKLFSLNIEQLPPGKRDKELRARPIQGRMRQGKVFIRGNAAWTDTFVTELLRFPGSAKDDQVDALAWIGQMMNNVQYVAPAKPEHASWKTRLENLGAKDAPARNAFMAA